MSKHDLLIRLQDMLDHAREAVALTQGRSRADLNTDRVLSLALVRLLEIVGEAANRVPDEVQDRYTDIPWREIIGLRNRLIHGYGAIDLDIVWRIISADLPPLIEALEQAIATEA
ncbi:MAG: DUF86 domain-containing protein [Chloroflexi bacterium]|nr:DUF86 domain-containing protein [Chloroflexota bacterium]